VPRKLSSAKRRERRGPIYEWAHRRDLFMCVLQVFSVRGTAGALDDMNAVFDTFRDPRSISHAKSGHSFAGLSQCCIVHFVHDCSSGLHGLQTTEHRRVSFCLTCITKILKNHELFQSIHAAQ
jgi:hypothetical protein